MSWNLPRIINNLEAEIETGYVHDPATKDFSLAGYDIRNVNLVKTGDVETNTVFSVNDELEKLNNFEATTTNPDVTTIIGKLNIENIDTNTIYDLTELTRIELNDNEVNIITQNLTFNGQDVLTNANLETLETKTFYISPDLSPLGTVFTNSIYADKFIINGATTPAYLLSDGSTIAVSGQNSQSNIYLYHNSTVHVSPPNVGEVRFNNANNTLATTLWISHITHGANGVDIDVFLALITSVSIIYLQEADNSLNYIKYNVTTNPVIIENNYITLQVSQLSSGGSGASNFGNVDLIMSIFSNDTEIDGRITAVETKTQNIQATSSKLTVNRSLELKLDEPDFFAIRSIDGFVNYLIFDDTIMNLYTNLNLNANNLSNVGSIKISSFENSNFFIKTDGTIDENDYLQATDTVITDLQAKVQNQTAIPNATTLNGYTTVILREAEPDFFLVKGDGNDLKFTVGRTSLTCGENMNMSNKIITALGAPVSSSDAVRKAYIDDLITPLQTKTQNITATASETVFNNNSSFVLRVANGDSFTIKNDDSPFSTAKFIVSNTSVQVVSVPLLMNTQKITLMGEPTISTDAATKNYVDTQDALKLNLTGGNIIGNLNVSGNLNSRIGTYDLFTIANTAGSSLRFTVSNTNAISYVTMSMANNILNGIPTPVSNDDAVNKLYVDTANNLNVKSGTLTAGSVPYFTATNTLSGASRNLFVQLGDSTIQSAIDAVTAGGAVGGSIQVSSGGSTQNVICSRQNYTIVGAICPPFTQTSQIIGNLTIGSAAFLSTRVRVSHMKFEGNLIFDNSTNQQLRSYFFNCDWNGTVSFPTSLATGTNGTQIFFDNCSFSGASAIVIPNQSLYTIFFTRCAFIGQTITNNQPVGNITKTVFTDCSYLPTLSTLGNCILNGLNTTLSSTQANFGSIVLGGSATSLLKGNGTTLSGAGFVKGDATLDTNTYTTMVSNTFTASWGVTPNIVSGTFTYKYIFDGTSKIVTLGIPHIRTQISGGPLALFSSNATSLPAIIRPATTSTSAIRIVYNGGFEGGYIELTSAGLISFARIASAWANNTNSNGSGNAVVGDYMYITYVA